jgi:prevent-host-death family protein
MTRISATEASRNFSDILNRAQYRGESFEVTRGNKVVARIEPVARKFPTLGEVLKMLAASPHHLSEEEAAAFEEDLKEIRKSAGPAPYKWD